ncbi:MAG: TIGR02996 domain-containing protein [Planctomycetia bacterium]|nr:TIGR02996 domain-containing protein [Planctomycetia bacterium]
MNDADFILTILSRPGDEQLRLVYADWLEERGDARAEFLRRESELNGVRREVEGLDRDFYLKGITDSGMVSISQFMKLRDTEAALQQRLAELRLPLDPRWLTWIDRTRIENCLPRFDFQCPVQWDQLALTDNDRVRHCARCDRSVYFCESLDEARAHAAQGHCLAVASSLVRTDRDVPVVEDLIDVGLLDLESIRKNMPPARPLLTERRLPLPLVERIRRESASFGRLVAEVEDKLAE